jgi:sphingomyelin phosphodiesterase acid-like 3
VLARAFGWAKLCAGETNPWLPCRGHARKEGFMSRLPRYLTYFFAIGGFICFGCGGGNSPDPPPVVTNYQVVVFSDLHFDPLYDKTLYSALVAADPSQWNSIFQTSKIITPSVWGDDTNYPLLQLALTAIANKANVSPVILYTGDLLGHGLPVLFYLGYCATQKCTYPPSPAMIAAQQAFFDKTVTYVTAQIRAAAGNVPVLFAIGNIDSYSTVGLGPDSTFLANNADSFYTQLLNGSENRQDFMSTFTSGGYYSAQALGGKILVLGLNTNAFVQGAPGTPNAELAWLDDQLASAQEAGQKVWLLMHVPPGADTTTTATNAAKAGTPGKVNETTTSMMWLPGYQKSFLQTLDKYPGLVAFTLGAHTHMDEYRILSTENVLAEVPAISPCFGENPSFRVFTIPQKTLLPTNYASLNYDLGAKPAPAQFNSFYSFASAYGMYGALQSSLLRLYPQLLANTAKQRSYIYYYNSGNTSVDTKTNAAWNPINNVDWPIFACGISKMDEDDYISCVNSY